MSSFYGNYGIHREGGDESSKNIVFIKDGIFPAVGKINTLYVTEDSIYQWNQTNQQYVNITGSILIYYDTTENWNRQTSLVSQKGAIYIYSDYKLTDEDIPKNIPGLKVGDGLAYVVDLPFMDTNLQEHTDNTLIHISSEDRANWNNKIRCSLDENDQENLIFTNN